MMSQAFLHNPTTAMTVDESQNAALVAHIVSQMEQNVQFLASQSYISQNDANAILSRLPVGAASVQSQSALSQLSSKFSNMIPTKSAAAPRSVPAPPTALQYPQARALWAYNEGGTDPNDLTFASGDVIEIIEETNADWWKGRFNGREGLLPSNYVHKIAAPAAPVGGPKSAYKPFGAALHGHDKPPPAGDGVNSVGLQEKPSTEEKQKGFGKYKSTLAQSAVGGAGFGAGAAIGGGLVRAIF